VTWSGSKVKNELSHGKDLFASSLDRQLTKYQSDEQRMLKEIYSADNYLTYYLKEKEMAV